jgi:glycine cleavage system aminomethyltransferase T
MDRKTGAVSYTLMLNEAGGILSDMTVIRLASDHFRLYVGTTALRHDIAYLGRLNLPEYKVSIEDVTEDFSVYGVMGPKAAGLVQNLGGGELNELGYFRSGPAKLAGIDVIGSRMSDVGEAG